MQIELQDLQKQLGITFVLVTHDQEEALSLSDRICVIRAGEVVQVGSPQELYDRPKTRYVADFVGTSNFFEGMVDVTTDTRTTITLADGQTYDATSSGAVAPGEHGCLSLRPEQIRMSRTSSSGALKAVVQNRIFLGEHTEYLVRHASLGSIIVMAPRQSDAARQAPSKGDTVWITWDADAGLILKND
jgi:spermidine/putrescine transport system ATP-binding protein